MSPGTLVRFAPQYEHGQQNSPANDVMLIIARTQNRNWGYPHLQEELLRTTAKTTAKNIASEAGAEESFLETRQEERRKKLFDCECPDEILKSPKIASAWTSFPLIDTISTSISERFG